MNMKSALHKIVILAICLVASPCWAQDNSAEIDTANLVNSIGETCNAYSTWGQLWLNKGGAGTSAPTNKLKSSCTIVNFPCAKDCGKKKCAKDASSGTVWADVGEKGPWIVQQSPITTPMQPVPPLGRTEEPVPGHKVVSKPWSDTRRTLLPGKTAVININLMEVKVKHHLKGEKVLCSRGYNAGTILDDTSDSSLWTLYYYTISHNWKKSQRIYIDG